jgi:hypothetical protein
MMSKPQLAQVNIATSPGRPELWFRVAAANR